MNVTRNYISIERASLLKDKYPDIRFKVKGYSLGPNIDPGRVRKYKQRVNECMTIINTYDTKGRHHSYNDRPAIRYIVNGKVCEKVWFRHGKVHRDDDKPAHISISLTKEKMDTTNTYMVWYRKGIETRADKKPYRVYYDELQYEHENETRSVTIPYNVFKRALKCEEVCYNLVNTSLDEFYDE